MPETNFNIEQHINLPDKYKKEVIQNYNELLSGCRNCLSEDEISLLNKSLLLALEVHQGEYLFKDIPYILHPLGVARIVSEEMGLGINSIVAAFLHELFDKKEIEGKEIKKQYGETIFSIVIGLNKISGINIQTSAIQTENFRKLILTIANDVRVVLVKIADRLHNMRIIQYKDPDRQLRMALETSYIYAPLAHRLGLYNIKSELEDLSLKYLDTETYTYIDQKLKDTKAKREKYISNFIKPIKQKFDSENLDYEIKGRTKSISSIWNKMKKQDVDFDNIYDIYAIRIIINSPLEKEKELCWKVYSVVSDFYQPNPNRMRDWISIPKSNGYESLHTTVLGTEGKWVEVQIRTTRMDEIAEKGLAAHWKYKGVRDTNQSLENWLSKIRDLLDSSEESTYDFIDNIKYNLYSDEIFIFTPKGDIKKLPVNSSVLDLAFEIHTEVGRNCIGAKINNKNAGIKEVLQNGDVVQILTSKTQKPNISWLNFVVTSKAKSKIKASLKEEKLKEADIGKELLVRRLKNWKIQFNDEIVNKLLKQYKLTNAIDFYFLISKEKIDLQNIKEILTVKNEEETEIVADKSIEEPEITQPEKFSFLSTDFLIIEDKIRGVDYKLSPCCNPVLGDKIFGFVTISEGIKIHRFTCPNAPLLLSKYPYRVVRAKWTKGEGIKSFQTIIRISGADEHGLLNHITDIISKDPKITLRSMNVNNKDGMFESTIKIFVESVQHLDALLKKFLKVKGVNKAVRVNY